ncbi:glucarate dehydratase [Actinorhabdospora filicis]|uniref:glucarate dehydratase n=1 Tax=Actinorhabdospora filicis TaxID=1785913 RepID=A0A9W6WAW0_9ACTN|nr:glucarate dehydratase family protein [Actinorhabdospora filicis]GLZ79433.1 glucarate dehydratase [Actinorhabdospora filicis]
MTVKPLLPIDDVVLTPVAFRDPPLMTAVGVHEPWALRTVVEVRAGGLTGLGETYGDLPHLTALRTVAAALPGLDVFDTNGLAARVTAASGGDRPDRHGLTGASSVDKTRARLVAAFETALLDLQGRALGRPVSDLLGGRVRDRVPFSAYLFYKWAGHPGAEPDEWGAALDPDGIVAQARELIARHGFDSIKLKGGIMPPDEEIAAVKALRAAFPDLPLRLDPNTAWTPTTAIRVAEATAGILEYLEDPTPGIDGMAEVAAVAGMPLATNMCVVGFADLAEAFAKRAVGVVLADHHYWGGLRACADLAAICRTWDVGVSMHSNSHLGISLAAMTHLASAVPNLTYDADTHYPWLTTDVVAEPPSFLDGAVPVPTGPGLGVVLDPDRLARMHEDYLRCGIRERDDSGYMRSVVPSYDPALPRW